MAKSLLMQEARKMRKAGISVKQIAKTLNVSKSTASVWVRDIILTIEQLETLRKSSILGAERGRLKNAFLSKEKWKNNLEAWKKKGIQALRDLSAREFLIAGLALYWGEGSKKKRAVEFCNSDPYLIRFLILWLVKSFDVDRGDLTCWVGINHTHREREVKVREYWSKITGLPMSQFRKTSFKKVDNKKIYDNFEDHYGTLFVRVVKPSRFYGKIIGLIEGLHKNMPG